jgi:uncharacterized membrane protein YhiD involved in acid resistance
MWFEKTKRFIKKRASMFNLELSKFNPETPSFWVMLITALMAFFLSSIIAVTYEFTTKGIYKKAHFVQSLALVGIVAATILQAIGESVAVGLGIIGALSIIRFRTSLSDPRNITFIFASLGAGIACGVMGFGIALTGTLAFCGGALVLSYTPLSDATEVIGRLRIEHRNDKSTTAYIEQLLKKFCIGFELNRLKFSANKKSEARTEARVQAAHADSIVEATYLFRLKQMADLAELENNLSKIAGVRNFRFDFQNTPTKV